MTNLPDLETEIASVLAGSYTPDGVRRWWLRRRKVLGGVSPREYLGDATDGARVARIRDLAQRAQGY